MQSHVLFAQAKRKPKNQNNTQRTQCRLRQWAETTQRRKAINSSSSASLPAFLVIPVIIGCRGLRGKRIRRLGEAGEEFDLLGSISSKHAVCHNH